MHAAKKKEIHEGDVNTQAMYLTVTCTLQQRQHGLFHMVPALTVPEVSFFQLAFFSLHQQILQQVLPLNRCNLPKKNI